MCEFCPVEGDNPCSVCGCLPSPRMPDVAINICEICGELVVDGQIMEFTIICKECVVRFKRKESLSGESR